MSLFGSRLGWERRVPRLPLLGLVPRVSLGSSGILRIPCLEKPLWSICLLQTQPPRGSRWNVLLRPNAKCDRHHRRGGQCEPKRKQGADYPEDCPDCTAEALPGGIRCQPTGFPGAADKKQGLPERRKQHTRCFHLLFDKKFRRLH